MSSKRRVYLQSEDQTGQSQPPTQPAYGQQNQTASPNYAQQPLQSQPFGQQPLQSPFGQPFGQAPTQNVPYAQPVQQVTTPPAPAFTAPVAPTMSTSSYDNSPQQPVHSQQQFSEPSFGLNSAPPMSSSQIATSQQQAQQAQLITKHKRVFAVDPESSYPTDQLASSMGQMNLGSSTAQTPQTFPSATQQTPQNQPYPATTTYEEPSSISPTAQCSSTYMRMSINAVPDSSNLLNKCCIPFGCVIHPMAQPRRAEDVIPVINCGGSGIIRCRRCRAYINPFATFTDSGRRWRCNLCQLPNDVPGDYFSPVDRSGRRTDLDQRPELSNGIVEYIAPSEYMVRPPQPPSYMFVIDVGYYSVTSGMFQTCVKTIQNLLDHFPGDSRTRIGFITYDTSVHFYNLKASLSQPQMLVVTDIDDIFLPLPDDMLVNLADSRSVIETLLNKFSGMFQQTQIVDSAAGVALKAAYNVINKIGGKILLFANTLPTLGEGKLVNREDLKLLGTDKEVNLLNPDDQYYKNFSLDCSRQQVTVDTFLFSSQFIDAATIGCMPQFTGGQLYYYPAFRADKDGVKFQQDLIRNITRETGWEAVFRIRCSKGMKVTAHYGNFFIRSTDLLALPSVDADKAFAAQFAHTDSTVASKYISIQSALLYTTSGGERRIRVFTQCLPVTNSLPELFKLADVDAVTAITAKMAIEKALSSKLSDAREALVNKCIDILAVYRSDVVGSSGGANLLLPEALKLFPLFILALVKNVIFRAGGDIKPDERTFYMMLGRMFPASQLLRFIYPRLFALHQLPPEAGTKDSSGAVVLPPILNLSSEKLDRKGVFLLDDGQVLYLWVGREVAPDFLEQLLAIPSLEGLDTTQLALPLRENDLSVRVNNIVSQLRTEAATYQTLFIIREGEPREVKWFSYFVEDRSKAVHSYYEFLVNVQQRIQAKIMKK